MTTPTTTMMMMNNSLNNYNMPTRDIYGLFYNAMWNATTSRGDLLAEIKNLESQVRLLREYMGPTRPNNTGENHHIALVEERLRELVQLLREKNMPQQQAQPTQKNEPILPQTYTEPPMPPPPPLVSTESPTHSQPFSSSAHDDNEMVSDLIDEQETPVVYMDIGSTNNDVVNSEELTNQLNKFRTKANKEKFELTQQLQKKEAELQKLQNQDKDQKDLLQQQLANLNKLLDEEKKTKEQLLQQQFGNKELMQKQNETMQQQLVEIEALRKQLDEERQTTQQQLDSLRKQFDEELKKKELIQNQNEATQQQQLDDLRRQLDEEKQSMQQQFDAAMQEERKKENKQQELQTIIDRLNEDVKRLKKEKDTLYKEKLLQKLKEQKSNRVVAQQQTNRNKDATQSLVTKRAQLNPRQSKQLNASQSLVTKRTQLNPQQSKQLNASQTNKDNSAEEIGPVNKRLKTATSKK